ncbi:MAG TPA: GFA family protein [Burkholderiaceae bacterium]|nr:GFA family protein [Burkholderiaceae bacterium]
MPAHPASDGGCLCGAVRYRIVGEPRSSSVCFCRSCRLASGAPSVAWIVVALDRFALLTGTLATVRSSADVTRSFCARCGTPIAYQHTDDPQSIELTTATLDEPQRFPPTREIWHRHRVPWAASDPRLPHVAGDREGDPATPP